MRFTIRDLLWLIALVAMGLTWGVDRWRQSAKIEALEDIAGLETLKLFSKDWDGLTAGVRNQNRLLRFRVDALTRELQSRGHQVEIDGCNVFVDRPVAGPDISLTRSRPTQSIK